ncbi:autocrine proliferation repressor protein A-like [Ptychodera flava]|uniref:autocrine proliferation repressor protein A-like n=1 Tax=Ptychodera flava TaxID=63121 RepID=UPI00396A041A
MASRSALFILAAFLATVNATPLDDYVNTYDPHYSYEELDYKHVVKEKYTVYMVRMTSQKWLTDNDVDGSIWWHYLSITIPHHLTHRDAAFLYITGKDTTNTNLPSPNTEDILTSSELAASTGTIGATLFHVPNQPLVFPSDPNNESRREDDIIAFTWRHYIDNPNDTEWIAQLPMTKSAVRAMDAVASFVNEKVPVANIDKFMVSGASKRGWTAWLTAAVDSRVIAVGPLVLDCLNMIENFHHFYQSLGGWPFPFYPYHKEYIMRDIEHPVVANLSSIIDPYAYRDRLTMPKYVITSSGDPFFLPDDSHYYFEGMKGETYLRLLPNAEHSMLGQRENTFHGLQSFFLSVLECHTRPTISWTRNQTASGGSITLITDTPPVSINAFVASGPIATRRDFRLLSLPSGYPSPVPQVVMWYPTSVRRLNDYEYLAEISKPATGWSAVFIQAAFPGPRGTLYEFTSEVNIVPDTFPYPRCEGEACQGILV